MGDGMNDNGPKTYRLPELRTFELVAWVSAPMPGTIDDWPANIQDRILAALQTISDREKVPLTIVSCVCEVNPDYDDKLPPGEEDNAPAFIRVIASEIVVVDTRNMQ
jgi:hypothetical protein